MTSFYEASTSFLNFDRFPDDMNNESPLTKLQRHYWTAKQLIRTKLGKKEDAHLVASDADFDQDLTLFNNIRETTRGILISLEQYHHNLTEIIETEQAIGDLMLQQGLSEKKHLAEVMNTFANAEHRCAKLRFRLREPLTKFYHDMDKFYDRAVTDCAITVDAGEKARLDYRGSLMWMKKMSDELNPEFEETMDKYRTAQNVVRQNKEKLDKLKEDTSAKVDVLKSSRTSLLVDVVERYVKAIEEFYEQSTKAYEDALGSLSEDIDTYEIDILKILNDPVSVSQEKDEQGRDMRRRVPRPKESPQPIQRRFPMTEGPDSSEVLHEEAKGQADGIEEAEEAIIRVESPLGILDLNDEDDQTESIPEPAIPTLPEKLLDMDEPLPPKLNPPQGWNPPPQMSPPSEQTPSGIPTKHSMGASSFFSSEFVNPVQEKFWNPFKTMEGKTSNFMPSSLIDQPNFMDKPNNQKSATKPGTSIRTMEEWGTILLDFDPLQGSGGPKNDINFSA